MKSLKLFERCTLTQMKKNFASNEEEKWHIIQQTFTCSKSTTETLEQGVKYVQSEQ